MKKYLLEIIVFISGAVVMIFELVGSRILAPYMGTSLVIWTSLIGIILGSLSLGYYIGGKLSDRKPNYLTLSSMIFVAALFITITALIKNPFLEYLSFFVKDIRIAGVVATIFLFAPASVLFGMVSPYAVRLKLKEIEHSGETIGSMYAISTVGSIFGTFLAGFVLIPMIGSSNILLFIVLSLLVSSALAYTQNNKKIEKKHVTIVSFLILITAISFVNAKTTNKDFIEISTSYNDIRIIETKDKETKRPIRGYITDPFGVQSAIFTDDNNDLVFDIYRFYRLAEHFKPNYRKTLMIGGGTYTYPQDFLRRSETGTMDVVEIDPELINVAKKYFDFKENDRINIYHEDGRTFINEMKEVYDVIIMDAFNSNLSAPFHLTTKEVVSKLYNNLSDDGVVLVNIISAIDGDKGKFMRAEIATYKTKFPQAYIFPVQYPEDGFKRQNSLVVFLKSENKPEFKSENLEFDKHLSHLWTKKVDNDLPILTDDYAPVDLYVTNIH
ncbi:fused MFS/spermidine synthase [Candidatus Parcubacteria bacterium]|nr:fused MFS/spermidine synthase [Candidatus Parcubacteria bacterium]